MLARHDWFWFSFWLVKKLVHEAFCAITSVALQTKASYLHVLTGRLTVWANGKKNSGLVNFISKSCLQFAQISSFYRKTTAKVWNWYQRWALTYVWYGTLISVWNIPSETIGLPFQMFRCSRKFSTGRIRKAVFQFTPWIYFSIGFPRDVW